MRKKSMWWIILAGVLVLGAALWGPIVSNVEQPKYKVFATEKNIQIRDYAPMIVVETKLPEGATRLSTKAFGLSRITSSAIISLRRK